MLQFNNSPTEAHFGCFQFLSITSKAPVNNHIQGFCGQSSNFTGMNAQEYDC